MAPSTSPRVAVVEIDGLWFRFSKLRASRSARGAVMLTKLLGSQGFSMLTTPEFWGGGAIASVAKKDPSAFERSQLTALWQAMKRTNASIDDWAEGVLELLAYDRGQGVQYSDTPRDQDAAGWVPIRDIETLDSFDRADHMTWGMLGWETIKLVYRPTFAVAGTDAGTQSAATTSTRASSPGGAAKPRRTGNQSQTGISAS